MNMFINTKNIAAKALTLISAAALTLSSCVQLGEEQDGAYGYLTITGFDVNVQVEQLVPTKGANLPNISEPNESDIVYKVTDKNGKVYQSNDNSWVSPLRIPVGSYTLEAWSGSNDEFGAPYFYGKTENASINIGNNTGNVTLYVANSLVAVTLGKDLEGHFTANEDKCVKLSVSDNSYVEATLGEYVFVPSGKELNVTVSGTPKKFECKLTADPKKAHNVIISAHGILSSAQMSWGDKIVITDPVKLMEGTVMDNIVYQAIPSDSDDWTTSITSKSEDGIHIINGLAKEKTYKVRAVLPKNTYSNEVEVISISAKAEHSTTDGLLDGTDIITNIVFPTSLNNSNPTISYELTDNSSKGIRRSFNENPNVSVADSDGSTSDANWPYLPKDYSYNLKATITVNGKQISSMTTIKVPAPSFTVTTRPVSSYTYYYDDKNVEAANNSGIGGSAIWIETKIGISDKLITKYGIGLTGNFSTNKGKSGSYTESSGLSSNIYICKNDNLKSLEWDEHKISYETKVTFDNVTVSNNRSDVPCHVTGLPYNIAFTSQNSQVSGWSYINISKYNKDYQFKYNESGGHLLYYAYTNDRGCNLFSPMYYVPEMLKVNYIATFSAGNTGFNSKSYTIYSGVTTEQNVKTDGPSTSISEKNGCLTNGFNSVSLQTQSPLSLSNRNRISISHNADLNWGQTEEHYIYIKEFIIQYAE